MRNGNIAIREEPQFHRQACFAPFNLVRISNITRFGAPC